MTKQITHSKRLILSFWNKKMQLLVVAVALLAGGMQAQTVITLTTASTSPWAVPAGVGVAKVECWAGGGAGGSVQTGAIAAGARGGGGAGGSYAGSTLTGLSGTYTFSVGAGGVGAGTGTFIHEEVLPTQNGGDTNFGSGTIIALGGPGGKNGVQANAATAGGLAPAKESNTGTTRWNGGNGGSPGSVSGGGGGSAGSGGNGGAGSGGASSAGAAGTPDGATGGAGRNLSNNGNGGGSPGGGGGSASISPATANTYKTGGSGGAGKINITYYPTPTHATNITYPSVANDQMTISWTNGGGGNRLVLVKAASAVDGVPVDGTSYTANPIFTSANEIGTGNKIVYNGNGSSVTVTGLTAEITYYVTVFENNGESTTLVNYNTVSAPTSSQATRIAFTGNKYAQSAITWSSGPWYDATSGGNAVTSPASGDNVFTQGNAVTITDDATCDNLTFTSLAGQIGIAATKTLTVRGKVDCTAAGSLDAFSTSDATSTLKLIGAALASPYLLVTDNAVTGMRPKKVVIETITNTYDFGVTSAGYSHGLGTGASFTVKGGTKLNIKSKLYMNAGGSYHFVVDENAEVTATTIRQNSAAFSKTDKITINGSITCTDFLGADVFIFGNNATIKTAKADIGSNQTQDGWWGYSSDQATIGKPSSITMGTNTTIEFNKTGSQNINGIVPVVVPYSINYVNLKLSGSGTKTVRSDLTVSKSLDVATGVTMVIPTGVTLNIAAGAKLTNSGTITNNGTINFLSDATNGTATYIGGAIGGTVNVNQSLQHSGAWRTWYVSSPVSETVAPTPALDRIKSFNETANTWSASLSVMEPKKGYLVVPVDATKDLLFTGTLNTGAQDITLTGRFGVGTNQGFNLVGNPYPSYLDWSKVILANGSSILRSSTMWYRTKNGTTYNFLTINGDGIGVPNTTTNEIPPMQAFWVRAAEGGSTLALTDAMRAHAPAANKLLKAPAAINIERTLVRLEVSNGVNTDEAVIYFSENAQNGLDRLDAPKMNNDNSAIPEIHTSLGNEKIVINAMNSIPMDTPIGLGFVAGNATSFSLRANEISNLPEGVKLILLDNVTFAETDLTDGITNYSFAPEETSIDRFSVIFRSAGVATGINNAINTNLSAYYNNSKITVLCGDDKLIGSELSVYNAVGQKIVSKQLMGSKMQVEGLFVPGVYILKANNTTTKVIVK